MAAAAPPIINGNRTFEFANGGVYSTTGHLITWNECADYNETVVLERAARNDRSAM